MATPICQKCWGQHYRARKHEGVNGIALSVAVMQRWVDDTCAVRKRLGLPPATDAEMNRLLEEYGCVMCKLSDAECAALVAAATPPRGSA
jgi:hypothetical protein